MGAYSLPAKTLFHTGGRIYSISTNNEGILIGSGDGYAYFISPDGQLIWKYGVGSEIYSTYLVGNMAFLGSRDDYVYELNMDGQEETKYYMEGDVTGIKVLGNTLYVSTGYKDYNGNYWGGIWVWTVAGKPIWQIARLQRAAFSIDSDGKIVVVGTGWEQGGYHGAIEVYDMKGNLKFSHQTGDWVKNVKICSGIILGASYDGSLYALSEDGKLLWKYNATNPIYSLDCNGKVIVIGTNDGVIHILDMKGRPLVETSIGVAPWSVKLDGKYIYVGTDSGNLIRLDRSAIPSEEISKAKELASSVENASGITLSPVENLLSKAENLFNNGDYENAYSYAQQAYALAENAREAWNDIQSAKSVGNVTQAVQAFKAGDYDQAKELALKVMNSVTSVSQTASTETETIKRTQTRVVVVESNTNYLPYAGAGLAVLLILVLVVWRLRSKPKSGKIEGREDPLQNLLSRYSDVEKIGEGGFAAVYRARRKDGTVVALKVPKNIDEETGRAFIREVSNWLHLRHPNIVRLYEANVVPVPYIEMEYCEGSLEREKKPTGVEKAAWFIFNTAEGLKYAHSKKIIHRDLKPSNILLKNGVPKISDWGLSKFIGEEKAKTMVFTPYYASPEQIAPETFGDVDERSDIWQLGVIFYELVTGRRPFEGNSLSSLAQAITTKEPVKPGEINPEAKEVEPIILKMLAKRKEERYRSAEELQRDLAKVLGIKYQRALEKSVSAKDFSKSAFYAGELALMHLKLGNYKDALKYLRDLKVYSRSGELDGLISQVELAMDEGIKLGEDFLNRAEVVIHDAKMGR
ncbi:protein kinase domain-containing protein [Thermococcus prieurii]